MSNGSSGPDVPQNEQQRILGIDYGTRRIGVSVSDPLRILATSYAVLDNDAAFWEKLKAIIRKENVEFVVVGLPLNLKGQKGQKAEAVERFVEEIKSRCRIDVVTWDERFTTSIAHQSMIDMGTKQKDRRSSRDRIDAMAAAIMLQGFLDRTKKSLSC